MSDLDQRVARAQGWTVSECGRYWETWDKKRRHRQIHSRLDEYTPTTNPAQWGELVERYKLVLAYDEDREGWVAAVWSDVPNDRPPAKSIGEAVCLAVIALLEGE